MDLRAYGLLIGGAVALLGACTLEPRYHRPASPVPALPEGLQGGTAANDIGWHEFFPDPQLQRLIALALADNRDLRVAALNVQSAQALYRIQRAQLLPSVDASAFEEVEEFPNGVLGTPSAAGSGGSGSPPSGAGGTTLRFYDVGIGFTSYELDFFGRIRSLNHAALQQYFSSDATRKGAQLSLVAEVASAYLSVLADQTLLEITRETLKSQSDSFALTQRLF